jgi:predicted transcriptional regulator
VKGIRIRPEKRGIRAALFDLEADIMQVVWSREWDWFAVADVHEALERRREIAYTTVMTTVARLFDKGVLVRRRDGRRYLYRAKHSREELVAQMASEVLDSLGPAAQDAAVTLLADRVAKADEDELSRLEKLIRARRKELRGG